MALVRAGMGIGGSEYTETLLWTNPSPSNDFVAQTITLSDDIDNYKYLAVTYKYAKGVYTSMTEIIAVSDIKKVPWNTSNQRVGMALPLVSEANEAWSRPMYYVSDTSLMFRACYKLASSGNSTSIAIPTQIIGIKDIGGVRTNEKYDILPFKSLPANTAISFTTKGEAKAIWITCKAQSSDTNGLILTNVNPNTGEIDNNTIYRARTSSLNTFDINTGRSFTVTNGTISSSILSSSAYYISCAYTY